MKVIIADDESIVRIGLKSIINWEENGFEVVGEASDGKKALELILNEKPDIAIIDMKMPVMDGLALMNKLHELKINIKILVLSGYNDFYLVKEAMKLGAEDYLLKLEVEPEALIKVLKKMSKDIKEDKQKNNREADIESHLVKNINIIRKNFLRDVINNFHITEKEFNKSMDFFKINLSNDIIYCFMIKIGELYRFEDISDEQLNILNFSIINISEEIVNDELNGYCFEGKTGEFFLLASSKTKDNAELKEQKLIDLSNRMREMLEQYLNVTATIGIGRGNFGMQGIRNAYNSAIMAMKYRFFKSDDGIILWNDVKTGEFEKENYSIINMKENIHKTLLLHKANDLESMFNDIICEVSRRHLGRNSICNISLELFYMINEFFEIYQLNAQKIMKKSYRSYQQLIHIESIAEAKMWINFVMIDLVEYINNEDAMGYPRIISRAQKYIEDHFNEDISLKEIADEVNLNPSYFSTMLKRYTGLSFSEYVTKVRIEKAKELLINSEYKVYEVGEMVGYHNEYYFNRIFKKVMGLTPGEYKKKI